MAKEVIFKKQKTGLLFLAFLILTLLIIQLLFPLNHIEIFEIHFIDVDQGDAILLRDPGGYDILIDGGLPQQEQNYKLNRYLKSAGIRNLSAVFLTHPHLDHYGGLIQVLEEFPVFYFFTTGVESRAKSYLKFLEIIEYLGIDYRTVHRGDMIRIGEVIIDVLHPREEFLVGSLNNLSLVFEVELQGLKILLTGDIEGETEAELVRQNMLNRVDILKVAHHGSATSSNADFLKIVDPSVAVIQAGKNNIFHPAPEVIARLEDRDIQVFRTDKDGDVVFGWNGSKLYLLEGGISGFIRKLYKRAI